MTFTFTGNSTGTFSAQLQPPFLSSLLLNDRKRVKQYPVGLYVTVATSAELTAAGNLPANTTDVKSCFLVLRVCGSKGRVRVK